MTSVTTRELLFESPCAEGVGHLAQERLVGRFALSVNHLYDRTGQYRCFRHFQPVATAGYSIHIYHIALEEANRVRRELGLPELSEVPRPQAPRKAAEGPRLRSRAGGANLACSR